MSLNFEMAHYASLTGVVQALLNLLTDVDVILNILE